MSRLPDDARDFLECDLLNPIRDGRPPGRVSQGEVPAPWLELLSRPFTSRGLEPVALAGDTPGSHAFDRLSCPTAEADVEKGPLVSVVMPCYQPDEGLLTSVVSILNQTYGSFEILLVDDASGSDYEELFQRAADLDGRITVLRMTQNGGPYLARNEAMSRATGEFITFQDADDWSHPARLSQQVAMMTESPSAPACHTLAVRAHDDLTHQWLGYPATRLHASSLMVRRSVSAQIGSFLAVRKGGDSEYAERIETEVAPIPTIDRPLAFYRLRSGSLSRADFTFQWTSPDRLAFVGLYRAALRRGRSDPLPLPVRFVAAPSPHPRTSKRLEVAYLADLSRDADADAALVATVGLPDPGPARGAERHGGSPAHRGLWHLENPWMPTPRRRGMHASWYDRILATPSWQVITRVDPVHVDRLVVLDVWVLMLGDAVECAVSADRVEVVEPISHAFVDDIAPPAVEAQEARAVIRRWFGVDPVWV